MIHPVWQERIGAGAVFCAGLVVLSEGIRLPTGRLASFGPGLFPLVVGTLICGFGVALLFLSRSEARGDAFLGLAWRPMIFVAAGMAAFAELVRTGGLVPATMALVILASLGEPRLRPVTSLIVAVVLAFTGVAIFVWGLGLALVPWRF